MKTKKSSVHYQKGNMNKYLVVGLFILFFIPSFGQTYRMYQTQNIHNQLRLNTATGEVIQVQDDGQKWTIVNGIERFGNATNRFRLFETQNIWTFIELDTFTGRLWQVQFSAKGTEYMVCVPINPNELSKTKGKSIFTIQPMTSMFQYYLINEETGQMWKFQWSTKGDEYRWIEPF